MKVIVYGRPANIFAAMMAMDFIRAGHQAVTREPGRWDGKTEDCDFVLIHGVRNQALIEAYQHVPVFIFEAGYLKRVNNRNEYQVGHWQISHAKLNGLPEFDCPADRFDALNLKIERAKGKGGYVLILGQIPNDSALNGTDHAAWINEQVEHYQGRGLEVKYRKHPRGGLDVPGFPSLDGELSEAVAGARLVVTYNSTAGFQVLLSGCPIVCDPCAPYYGLSGEKCPTIAERRAFFHRAAYGQWRVDETPQAVQFLINEWLPRCH